MDLSSAMTIASAGMRAQSVRLRVTAENLANAQTTRTAEGGPYRRKTVVLEEASGGTAFRGALDGAMRTASRVAAACAGGNAVV